MPISATSMSVPDALILEWTNGTLRVRCEYCIYSHWHAFGKDLWEGDIRKTQAGWKLHLEGTRRQSDCFSPHSGQYKFRFPGHASFQKYGWKVDSEDNKFVTTNSDGVIPPIINDGWDGRTRLPEYKEPVVWCENSDDDESDSASSLTRATEAICLHEPVQTPQDLESEYRKLMCKDSYRKSMYISACILRDISLLDNLINRYPDDKLIYAVDDTRSSGVYFAAIEEGGTETVKWLHSRGGSIDIADYYGRTPLMEAALWGRLETVTYLVDQGADMAKSDGNGMSALDLAQDTERNRREREKRGGIYREPSNSANQRAQIVKLLTRMKPTTTMPSNAPVRGSAFFIRNNLTRDVEIYRPAQSLAVPDSLYGRRKAFATLDRGPKYPYINAMSGYSQDGWENVLDNAVWTSKAEALRKHFGLPQARDKASHVETQLLAYLADRHTLFGIQDETVRQELESALPACDFRSVTTVSKDNVCGDCRVFAQRFRQQFPHLTFELRPVGDNMRDAARSESSSKAF